MVMHLSWQMKVFFILVKAYIQYLQREPLFTDQNTFNHGAKNKYGRNMAYKKELRISANF